MLRRIKWTLVIVGLALLLVVGAVGVAGGLTYQPDSSADGCIGCPF